MQTASCRYCCCNMNTCCKHALTHACLPLLQAKQCMLFSGTAVSSGTVIGIVTGTGMQTEMGKIQDQIKVKRSFRSKRWVRGVEQRVRGSGSGVQGG